MRSRITVFLFLLFVAAVLPAPALSAEYEINLGRTASIHHHYHTSSELFAKLVAEKTGGKVNIVIFPAGQLGSLPDMTESVRLGTQDIVLTADPIIGNTIMEFEALYLPYIFRDYEHVGRFEGSEAAKILEDLLLENGMILLGWWENGFRVITNNKRPIRHPDDMAGLKLRIGESKMAIDTFVLLKANPTPIAMSELFAALQLGTVDGQENPTGRILSARYYEVQKYLSVTRHQHVFEPLVMNLAKFKSLPPEFQQVLLDAGREVAKVDRKAVADTEADELAQLEQKGMLINEVDVAAFQKSLSPMYDQYMKERGERWGTIVKMIQEL